MSTRLVLLASLLAGGCSGAAISPSGAPSTPGGSASPDSAPTTSASASPTWLTSTPEEQGIDSGLLAEAAAEIGSKQINLHSMIVIRHGKIVVEKYFHTYTADRVADIWSITKGVVAALIGIAIERGSIDSVNHKVLDYFPNLTIANNDARKQSITIENLLSMNSGFAWSDDVDMDKMGRSGSQVSYVLDLPMAAAPGEKFNYNSGAPGLLCAILEKATGMSTTDFANAYLFGPLGITDALWGADSTGLVTGGYGIQMTPRDLATIGQLYLGGGEWNGKQIVPASWVKASFASHSDPMLESQKRSGYGYLVWLQTHGAVSFQGLGGQYITVVPDQDLVVVFTADLTGEHFQQPYDLFESYILPAVKSNDPLPANPTAAAKLESALKALP